MSKTFGKVFGSKPKTITQPTGFETLPGFAREALEGAVTRGEELSLDPSLFAPAGLVPQQQQALAALSAGIAPTSPEAFQQGLTTFGDPFEEQVVQSAIRDIQEAGAGQLSDIGSFASAAGGFGGTRQALLESELQRNLQRSIGDVSGGLRSQGFQSAADRTLGDISRGQQVAGQVFGLADLQRQIQQGQQQAPVGAVNFLADLARGVPTGGGGISQAQAAPGLLQRFGQGGQSFSQGVGGFGRGIGGIGSAISTFSDRRLKNNIKHVDRKSGFNIYEFAYNDIPGQRFQGVMAQEVQSVRPDAVETINGYLAVNYNALGLQMMRV